MTIEYEVQFPMEQFKNALPDAYIPGWRRRFMICVVRGLIMHDRLRTAYKDPSCRKNHIRNALGGLKMGHSMEHDSRINGSIVRKRFPKNWDRLVSDEINRIMDLTDPKSVVK